MAQSPRTARVFDNRRQRYVEHRPPIAPSPVRSTWPGPPERGPRHVEQWRTLGNEVARVRSAGHVMSNGLGVRLHPGRWATWCRTDQLL